MSSSRAKLKAKRTRSPSMLSNITSVGCVGSGRGVDSVIHRPPYGGREMPHRYTRDSNDRDNAPHR